MAYGSEQHRDLDLQVSRALLTHFRPHLAAVVQRRTPGAAAGAWNAGSTRSLQRQQRGTQLQMTSSSSSAIAKFPAAATWQCR